MNITIRPLVESDKELFESWLAKDEIHKSLGITWEDVIKEGMAAWVVLDERGNPIMIVRTHLALRVAIQFNPDTPVKSARYSKDVLSALGMLSKKLKAKEIIIRPGGKAIRFTEKLGFADFIGKFIGV